MKIDEVNTSNLDKYLEDYPKNVKTALKKLYLCSCGEGKHIVKYYKIGYFGVPEGLQREVEIRQFPQNEILKKYYPELGNVRMTFCIHLDTSRISPVYYDTEYHSFTEEMMGNKAMWDEMANVKLSPTVEYAEEKPLDEQYEEWKQYKLKGTVLGNDDLSDRYNSLNEHCKKMQKEFGINNVQMLPIVGDYGLSYSYFYAAYLAELEHNKKLKRSNDFILYLSLLALAIGFVGLIINLIRILQL